jgi:L-lactate dehydrogenase complex protein LldG
VGSREEILAALRRAAPPDPGLPSEPVRGTPYADLALQLGEAVQAVGGAFQRVPDAAALREAVAALAARLDARRVVSRVPDAGAGPAGEPDAGDVADPHQLEGVDLAVIPGRFAVAENGAVWVAGEDLGHRAVFVIAQHLALVVPAAEIVNDLHEAYARIRFDGPGFGLFVAGPSKTADIEQALVIGAHGARSCAVFLVG